MNHQVLESNVFVCRYGGWVDAVGAQRCGGHWCGSMPRMPPEEWFADWANPKPGPLSGLVTDLVAGEVQVQAAEAATGGEARQALHGAVAEEVVGEVGGRESLVIPYTNGDFPDQRAGCEGLDGVHRAGGRRLQSCADSIRSVPALHGTNRGPQPSSTLSLTRLILTNPYSKSNASLIA